MIEGHSEKRNRELRAKMGGTTGGDGGAGLRRLAHDMKKLGMAVHYGKAPDGPVH
jgi:hypothetical protein